MATASSLLSEEQFLCSICLDVFTDPITTPCGHNYCKRCITHYWDTNSRLCPLCKKYFKKRPRVFVNTCLSDLADQFRKSLQLENSHQHEPANPDEVSCDICTETKFKAQKSCLVCLASYCETHLEPHQRVSAFKRHKLIDPVKNLEDIMCRKHDRPLTLFCKTDHVCVCQFCTEADHQYHRIVSLEDGCEGKKVELGKTEADVQQMILERQTKIQEVRQSVDLSLEDADREIADSVQAFTALSSCIERSQAEVVRVIEEKVATTRRQAEGFIQELRQEITELKKRSAELQQLLDTEDHLHLLQNFTSVNAPPPTKDWSKVTIHQPSYVGIARMAVAQLEKALRKEMEKKLHDAELRRVQQYAVDVTLDPNSANPHLVLSEDGKQVKNKKIRKENLLPSDNTQRFFPYLFVLGKQSFSSGKFYYEVEVKDKTRWSLGVARESIDRKLDSITQSPDNGYWTIWLRNGNEYYAAAEPAVLLPVREKLHKVAVFVDYEEGLVSFYDGDTGVILHSFIGCSFTEKLCPVFCPGRNDGGKNYAPLTISPVYHAD